jgi:hypothetical protein
MDEHDRIVHRVDNWEQLLEMSDPLEDKTFASSSWTRECAVGDAPVGGHVRQMDAVPVGRHLPTCRSLEPEAFRITLNAPRER